jgi:hypothetical protein
VTGSEQGSGGGHDRIGSAAEEAAKLLGALSGWASDLGHDLDAHLATGDAECTYCPICRTVHLLREASPEIGAHLASAGASLAQAAASLVAAAASASRPRERSAGVENIALDGDDDWLASEQPEGDQ